MRTHRKLRWLGRVLLGVTMATSLMPAGLLHAQTKLENPEAYRDRKITATATFLDRTRTQEERLEALKDIGYPDEATFAALLTLGLDRTQSDAIRWEGLKRLPFDDNYLAAVLKILNDPGDGGEELDALLLQDLNRRIVVSPPAKVRQSIQAVSRKLLDDKRDKVRLQAYRALVSNHDSVAINLLVESLQEGLDIPIPLFEAIDLLDLDGSTSYIGTLRPYLHHADAHVQAKAVKALAVDPESRPAIVELARSPRAPEEVRLNALRSLAREDSQFGSYAIPLVEDPREDARIRHAAMHAFVGRMNYNKIASAEQIRFAQAIEKITGDEGLRTGDALKLKESAQELHVYLKQAFPEIRTFYERQ